MTRISLHILSRLFKGAWHSPVFSGIIGSMIVSVFLFGVWLLTGKDDVIAILKDWVRPRPVVLKTVSPGQGSQPSSTKTVTVQGPRQLDTSRSQRSTEIQRNASAIPSSKSNQANPELDALEKKLSLQEARFRRIRALVVQGYSNSTLEDRLDVINGHHQKAKEYIVSGDANSAARELELALLDLDVLGTQFNR